MVPCNSINETPKFAVCLAVYNGKQWLSEQLESIVSQFGVDVKVFVSVDLSVDGSYDWLELRAKEDKRICLLSYGQIYGGAAPNFFRLLREVDFSKFDYVSLADQDDIWLLDKLLRAHQTLARGGFDCYSSNVLAFWEDGAEKLVNKAQAQNEWDFLFESAGPGCTYVLKLAVVQQLKNILLCCSLEIEKLGLGFHDWFIYAFARSHGFSWIIDPWPSMAYRQHSGNQVGVNSGWNAFKARATKIISGEGISQSRLIARINGLESSSFCQPWRRPGRIGVLWLAFNAHRVRRKISDRFLFVAACLLIFIVGDHSDE